MIQTKIDKIKLEIDVVRFDFTETKDHLVSSMRSLAHIVNPFIVDPSSDLFIAQPITFESMRRAKNKASAVVRVELFSAQFIEDRALVPIEFIATEDLQRSVLNLENFETTIKLPLIEDILERLYTSSNADYLIYTNVDIGLYPNFYLKVNHMIDQGYDAFIINRRRLSDDYKTPDDLEKIWSQKGKQHPGFDCFVFHRSLYPKLKLKDICIGVPFMEISFSQNLFALSQNFKLVDKEILTFHLGMEIFKKRAPKEYFHYNRKQFWQLINTIEPAPDLKKFPYANYSWLFRMIRWGLHPCIPIRLVLKLQFGKRKR